MSDIIDEGNLDFSGIKGQPELTNNFATTDIAEAFLNDPYDWDGPKAARHLRHRVRHGRRPHDAAHAPHHRHPGAFRRRTALFPDRGIWDLENSGQHATWFAARSDDPAENMAKVHLYPEEFYFPAGGASVHHLAAAGEITLARLAADGRYRMQVTLGRFEPYDDETNEALMRQSTYVWPHAFTRFDAPAEVFLSRFGANHIHAVPGDITDQLAAVCGFFDVTLDALEPAPPSRTNA